MLKLHAIIRSWVEAVTFFQQLLTVPKYVTVRCCCWCSAQPGQFILQMLKSWLAEQDAMAILYAARCQAR